MALSGDNILTQGVNFGSTIGGGIINAIAQNKANKQNQANFERMLKFNHDEAELNAYRNSIIEQARQMKASGINPASGNTLGLSSGSTSAHASGLPNISPVNGFGSALGSSSIDVAQIKNIEADTKVKEAEARNTDKHTDWVSTLAQNQIDLNNAIIRFDDSQASRINSLLPEEKTKLNAEINNINKSTEQMSQNIQTMVSQIRVNDKNIKLMDKQIDLMVSQMKKNYAEASNMNLNTKLLAAEFKDLVHQTKLFTQTAETNLGSLNLGLQFDQDTYQFRFDMARREDAKSAESLTQAKQQTEIQTEQLNLLKKQNEYYDYQQFIGGVEVVGNLLNGATSNMIGFGNMRNGSMNANTYRDWNNWQHNKARHEAIHGLPSRSSEPRR